MGEKDAVTKTVQSHDPVFADIVNGLLMFQSSGRTHISI